MSRSSSSRHEYRTSPWEAAAEAARRAGLSLDEWLEETWRLYAAEFRVDAEGLDEDERAYAIAERLQRRLRQERGSRRSDHSEPGSAASRHHEPREADRLWSHAARALDDMESQRDPEPRRHDRYSGGAADRPRPELEPERYFERPRDFERSAGARQPRAHERHAEPPAPRSARLSIDDAIEEIAARQSELDAAAERARRGRPQANENGQALLRSELAKLANSLSDLQRRPGAGGASQDIEALRGEVAHIANGLAALAPRDSVEHLQSAVYELSRRLAEAREGGLVSDFIAPVERLLDDLKRAVVGAAPTAALEAVERRLGALARNVDALAQTRIDPDSVADLLEHSQDIRQMLAAAAGDRPKLDSLQTDIADLARRLDRIAERGQTSAGLEAVLESVAQIREDLELQNPMKAVKALDGRLDALVRMVDQAASQADVDAHFAQLGTRLDAMHRDLAERAPDVRRLEAAIESLQQRLDEARPMGPVEMRDILGHLMGRLESAVATGADPAAVSALEEQIARVAARVDEYNSSHQQASAAQSAELTRIESILGVISRRLEDPLPVSSADQVEKTVQMLIERFEETLRNGATGEAFTAIEQRLAELAARIDAPVTAEVDTARLEAMIQNLAARMQDPYTAPDDVADIKHMLAGIADRMDAAVRGEADPVAFRTLEQQIATLSTRVESANGAAMATIEHALEQIHEQIGGLRTGLGAPAHASLEQQLGALVARMEDVGGVSTEHVERALGDIYDQMDRLRSSFDAPAHAAIERQLGALAARMESIGGAGIENIERALGDIYGQIERLRSELDTRAREAIEREMSDFRSMHSDSDRRTHATLNAVHETLEKVVDRLAMLEDEMGGSKPTGEPSQPAIKAAPAVEAAPAVQAAPAVHTAPAPALPRIDDPDGYTPSIELNFGPAIGEPPGSGAVAASSRAAEPAAPQPPAPVPQQAAQPRPATPAPSADKPVSARKSDPRVDRAASAPKISSAFDDDFLLEPGSGKPSARLMAAARNSARAQSSAAAPPPLATQTRAAPAIEDVGSGALDAPVGEQGVAGETEGGAQATFIAAVRRAQQAASEAAAPRPGTASAGNRILEEARSRARAAAERVETVEDKPAGGVLDRARSLIGGRKRTTMLGLGGFLVLAGALHVALVQTNDTERQTSAALNPPAQQSAAVRSAEDAGPQKMSTRAEALSRTASAAADMTPVAGVAAIAAQSGLKSGNAAQAPRSSGRQPNPYILAATGDAHAQFEVGARFADGRNAPKDATKAIEWLEKAAAQSFAPAQYRLGVIYEKGLGVTRDAKRAHTLYLAAAERGHVKAMHNLGALLADGSVGGKPDYAGAARWFRTAAEHGVRDSQFNYAVLAARGLGVKQDLVQSYAWFAAAVAQGDPDSGAKLKEVASRLDSRQLAVAQSIAAEHRPLPVDAAVNDPPEPEGGWAEAEPPEAKSPTAEAPAKRKSNASARQPPPRASARSPKISSL